MRNRENYRSAFVACRKHRIDLNIIVDHDRDAFLRNIPRFVDQVSDVDYLNLLLAGLGYVSLSIMHRDTVGCAETEHLSITLREPTPLTASFCRHRVGHHVRRSRGLTDP